METKLEIPEKAFFLITDKSRYKVIYGGRGSAKSWSAARALIILCLQKNLRILCTRELQTSIKDSVHKLLKDQISELNLEKYFYITKDTIKSVNGSEFLFKGIKNNVSEIKSLEGIDICWVEEAAKMSVESWETLTPTIRKPSSEIWIIFNPVNVDDIIYKKFVIETPDNAKVEKMNYEDNPWFADPLKSEMEYDKKFNYELYEHKWLGNPKLANDAQIFKNKYEVIEFTTPDIKELYQNRFFYGADCGFAEDATVLIRCFIQDRVLYIDHEAYGVGIEILELPQFFELVPGAKEGVIYGDSARPDIISFLRSKDYNINPAAKGEGSVKAGIDYIKDFEKVVIHPRCKKTIDEFKLYSFKIDRNSGEILPMVVDKYNHCIDGLRYSLSEYIKRKNDIKVFSF